MLEQQIGGSIVISVLDAPEGLRAGVAGALEQQLDGRVKGLGHRHHDGRAEHPEDVVHKQPRQQNDACSASDSGAQPRKSTDGTAGRCLALQEGTLGGCCSLSGRMMPNQKQVAVRQCEDFAMCILQCCIKVRV